MKAVLISIQPKWCELIARGKKTVEVRRTKPKLDVPFKCYIYETKGKLRWCNKCKETDCERPYPNCACWEGQGKVIGEFVCDQIDEIGYSPEMHGKYISDIDDIHYVSCVDFEQMFDYLADGYGYGWHISDLVMYDKPKHIVEFCHPCDRDPQCNCSYCIRYSGNKPILHAPQSWCYVEEVK